MRLQDAFLLDTDFQETPEGCNIKRERNFVPGILTFYSSSNNQEWHISNHIREQINFTTKTVHKDPEGVIAFTAETELVGPIFSSKTDRISNTSNLTKLGCEN